MRVLISAFACQPGLGSEAKVGWDAANVIAQLHECHVVTHVMAQPAIKEAQRLGNGAALQFHYFGKPFNWHPSRTVARMQSWLIYRKWQASLLPFALELHRRHKFDIAHHVTYASWRIPSRLWRLGIPFVFGPIGGGSTTPPAFRSMLGRSARAFEFLRDTTTAFSAQSHELRLCFHNAAAVLAADSQTADFLARHGTEQVHRLCQVFFSEKAASKFMIAARKDSSDATVLRIFSGGNLEGRKGTQLSLRALAVLKGKGIPFSYTYGGWGPDLNAMKLLAERLGIAKNVWFHEGFSGLEYAQRLAASDVYLLPSIRETAGITMMEAMLAGCYPIVLAGTGAGDIVQRTGGAAIKADSPENAVRGIVDRLEWCYRHRNEMRQEAGIAGAKIRSLYSDKSYQSFMAEIYTEAIEKHRQTP
ncbi:MAG: glycosyltransferase [Chthoniobacterales bacterium]|nr:glycosyltransferase [Chthoniobacterales bacterium]